MSAIVLISSLEDTVAFGVRSSDLSRAQFMVAVGGMVAGVGPACAKDSAEALKGTKKDPAFEQCLSVCMYDCTKPKGSEQKSRAECLPECKEKCATSKQQLMKGEPKPE
jgi:hypothetical protein